MKKSVVQKNKWTLYYCVHSMKKMDNDTYSLWLAEAENDFEMGDVLFNAKRFNGAVFYFIQAAEKAIKALLFLLNEQPWGHSLLNLLRECEKNKITVSSELRKGARELERHYAGSRYPDASPGKSPKDAYDEAKTKIIRETVLKYLDFVKKEAGGRISP